VGSIPKVRVLHAAGCHLCERALAKVRALREELEFELEEIAIDGSPELEARYRELIPVVEIDGEQVFTYHVHENAFRRRLGDARGAALRARGSTAGSSEPTGRPEQG
jgi:glutaredoxin